MPRPYDAAFSCLVVNAVHDNYFESATMKGLFQTMQEWQQTNHKRLLSTNIQRDEGKFCCIALTNPTEVVIFDGSGSNYAGVSSIGALYVKIDN